MQPENRQVPVPGIYRGTVRHERFRSPGHVFRYRLSYLLLDPAAGEAQAQGSRLFGWNRRRWFSYFDADHGRGLGLAFADDLRGQLEGHGVDTRGMQFRVLCLPRMFGYVFNPISVIYCFDAAGIPRAVIYEVNNTFGERTHYVLAVDTEHERGAAIAQECDKTLFVSPFFDLQGHYRFRLTVPGERLHLAIDYHDADLRLRATFSGTRSPLTRPALRRLALTSSFDAVRVVGGIHYEAFKLWLKGAVLRPHVARKPDSLHTEAN